MTYLLRKISMSKWELNKGKKLSNYSADSITGCNRTKDNTLSVWFSETNDFNASEVNALVVALATTMDQPSAIDLLWLDEKTLTGNGIEIKNTPGESKLDDINQYHRDLVNLNYDKLGTVSKHIVDRLNIKGLHKRYMRSELIDIVAGWIVSNDSFEVSDMKDKWHSALNKKIISFSNVEK